MINVRLQYFFDFVFDSPVHLDRRRQCRWSLMMCNTRHKGVKKAFIVYRVKHLPRQWKLKSVSAFANFGENLEGTVTGVVQLL